MKACRSRYKVGNHVEWSRTVIQPTRATRATRVPSGPGSIPPTGSLETGKSLVTSNLSEEGDVGRVF